MIVVRATSTSRKATDEQVVRLQRFVSHNLASLDYSVDPGPSVTITVRDCVMEDLAPAVPKQIEGILGCTVTVETA